MLLILTSKQRMNSFRATRGLSPTFGKERGWPPITRRQFEALLEPDGALFVGNPRSVADKFLLANETLEGIETASLQMSVASLPHAKRMYATELLGTKVAPAVLHNPPKRIQGRAVATTRNT
jgi:hypothetical protein